MESLSFMILSIVSFQFLNLSIATTVSSPSQRVSLHTTDTSNLLLQLNDFFDTGKLTPAFTAKESTFPYYILSCKDPEVGFESKNGVRSNKCCLPLSTKQVQDYKLVTPQVPRKRQPLQKASFEYLNKFKEVIEKLKALPDDDPRSFNNQAKLHCAYSNGIYPLKENGEPERKLKIHNSWLFFPFHRWDGMEIPAMFEAWEIDNALYDSYRNNHRRPAVVDLDYGAKDRYIFRVDQIRINRALMNRQMILVVNGIVIFSLLEVPRVCEFASNLFNHNACVAAAVVQWNSGRT
ncbi:polyphenol oxidase I, chloroplastic-like protein [Tanacetum coccineum]